MYAFEPTFYLRLQRAAAQKIAPQESRDHAILHGNTGREFSPKVLGMAWSIAYAEFNLRRNQRMDTKEQSFMQPRQG